ncbi:DNA primase family protein [Bacillus cereus]|uniref:DNA primase family protein n=1 Tax=Bacillus cereus TaxID=1396 RepID=UPI00119DAEFC|nr:phage/plasmid primase, P4 family [Bacillus cereus]
MELLQSYESNQVVEHSPYKIKIQLPDNPISEAEGIKTLGYIPARQINKYGIDEDSNLNFGESSQLKEGYIPSVVVDESLVEFDENIKTNIDVVNKPPVADNQELKAEKKNGEEKKFINNLELNILKKLVERHQLKCLKGNVYLYKAEKGYFIELEDYQVRTIVRSGWSSKIEGLLSKSRVDDIIDRLKSFANIQIEEDDLDPYPNLINFNDCVLDIKTGKISNHSPDYRFTSFINANYCNKYSIGGNFLEFINQCTNDDENKVKQLQELIGYSISNYSNAKKWFVLLGKPHTGKSTILELLTEIIGEDYTSNVPLHELNNKFALADLFKKKLNVSGELNDAVLKNINIIKALTGNDRLRADRKYQLPINFINRAKIVMAGNLMPQLQTADNTSAFTDRILFVIFNNSIPVDKRDYKLKEKLISERNFIVQWAIKGLKRLIKNNFVFTECSDSINFKKHYQKEMNNVNDFIKSLCFLDTNNEQIRVHKRDLYIAYINYSRDNCQSTLSGRDFFNEIRKLPIKQSKFRYKGSNPLEGFIGLALRTHLKQEKNI